jgi:hypothetical protein
MCESGGRFDPEDMQRLVAESVNYAPNNIDRGEKIIEISILDLVPTVDRRHRVGWVW